METLHNQGSAMKIVLEHIKWISFRLLGLLQRRLTRSGSAKRATQIYNYESARTYHWVYCTTIGEMNACRPFLDHLYDGEEKLVFLTDRKCYKESYQDLYPKSIIVEITGEVEEYRHLQKNIPPASLTICETPGLIHDAPCRLSYGLIRSVKKSGKKVYLVNGWLYGYAPSCHMDSIEKLLFHKSYAALFSKLAVQTDGVRQKMISAGVDPRKITVTGNMKFDSVTNSKPEITDPLTRDILSALITVKKSVLVAGCLSDQNELGKLIKVHQFLRSHNIALISILVPRHPENTEVMEEIRFVLEESGLAYQYRSEMTGTTINNTDLLILDTIGELKAFYSVGDICYMGQNHNVLEPLSFNKPVFTISGWEETYPSFSVFQATVEKELIQCHENFERMAEIILDYLKNDKKEVQGQIGAQLIELTGATDRTISWLAE